MLLLLLLPLTRSCWLAMPWVVARALARVGNRLELGLCQAGCWWQLLWQGRDVERAGDVRQSSFAVTCTALSASAAA
jgi:hypothetical protein